MSAIYSILFFNLYLQDGLIMKEMGGNEGYNMQQRAMGQNQSRAEVIRTQHLGASSTRRATYDDDPNYPVL